MKQKLVIFFVLVGNYFGFYLSFPLFPTIFLTEGYSFLSPETSMASRTILLGCTYTIYYIGSFMGTPILGRLSDRIGRKHVLCTTLLFSGCSYILCASAIQCSSLLFLLVARFCTGVFETSYSIAYSVLVDGAKNSDNKLTNLEFWTTTLSNIGWILGSYIGWNLIGSSSLSVTFLSLPFFGACFINLLALSLVFLFFHDTRVTTSSAPIDANPFGVVFASFKQVALRPILMSNTTFYVATSIFACYTPIFLLQQYHFEPTSLSTVDSYLSFASCLAPFTYGLYTKYCSRKETVCISSLGIGLSILLLIALPFKGSVWFAIFLTSYFTSVGYSYSTFLVTDYTPHHRRGEALGVNYALYVLIEAIASFICGLLAAISFYLPFIIAVLCALFSAGWIFHHLVFPRRVNVPV